MVLVDSLVCLPVPCSRPTLVFSLANTVPGIQRRGGGGRGGRSSSSSSRRRRRSSSSCCGRGNGDSSSSSCVVVLAVVRSGFAAAAGSIAPGSITGGMTKPVVDKAVIVGGGLGGLAAAIQLRKIGIDVQVSRLAGYPLVSFSFHSMYFAVSVCVLRDFSLLGLV